ncbi:MAG: conjugal transfer protein TrbD [Halothiobacillaceae bacterium]
MSSNHRTIPIHTAFNRAHLLLGAERELALLSFLIVALVVISGMNPLSFITGALLWSVMIGIVIRMAKADTMLSKVYLKHIKYRDYYPAKSGAYQRN